MLKVLFCKHCNQVKDNSEFYPSLLSKCKKCKQSQQRAHRAKNREAVAEYCNLKKGSK